MTFSQQAASLRMSDVVRSEIDNLPISLDASAQPLVERYLAEGLAELVRHNASAAELDAAEDRLRAVLQEMAQEAQARGITDIDAATFDALRLRICPIWPFC